jgi:hypothetical protein
LINLIEFVLTKPIYNPNPAAYPALPCRALPCSYAYDHAYAYALY